MAEQMIINGMLHDNLIVTLNENNSNYKPSNNENFEEDIIQIEHKQNTFAKLSHYAEIALSNVEQLMGIVINKENYNDSVYRNTVLDKCEETLYLCEKIEKYLYISNVNVQFKKEATKNITEKLQSIRNKILQIEFNECFSECFNDQYLSNETTFPDVFEVPIERKDSIVVELVH